LITGGSMGIGLACAEACVEAGAQVMICARREEPLRKALASLLEKGVGRVAAQVADVTKQEDIKAVLDRMIKYFGAVDGVIHCAAIMGPIGRVVDVDPEAWFDGVRVNLFGTFLVARQSCRIMMAAGGGRIVLFSGGGATSPFPNYTAYACGKVGVVRLTETLAEEMRPFNIGINCLAPGFVTTRMHDATLAAGERAGVEYLDRTIKEIKSGGVPPSVAASAAVFLLSDRAKDISGKLVAAVYDSWDTWPDHLNELQRTDVFTLRRIVPKDRGMDWQ